MVLLINHAFSVRKFPNSLIAASQQMGVNTDFVHFVTQQDASSINNKYLLYHVGDLVNQMRR